jgi:hypothetical protein
VPSSAKGDGFASAGTERVGDTPVGWLIANQVINPPIVPRMLPEGYGKLLILIINNKIKFFFDYFFLTSKL